MTGAGNWTWLIPGRVPTLIDAGTGDPRHLDASRRARRRALAQVLVTHAHVDHASGAPAHCRAVAAASRFLKMPWPERDAEWPVRVGADLADGRSSRPATTLLAAVHTPGHAPDHLCFWHEETRTLFCGDLAVQGHDGLDSRRICAATSPTISRRSSACCALEPGAAAAGARPGHRRSRGAAARIPRASARARAADCSTRCARATRTPMRHRARDLSRPRRSALVPMARESVLAHLLKLEREGARAVAATATRGISLSP